MLVAAIRKSPDISGFRIPGGREVKISQYADDNTCIVTNSYGIVKVIDVFNEYGRASGARLNNSKTKGLWLGVGTFDLILLEDFLGSIPV